MESGVRFSIRNRVERDVPRPVLTQARSVADLNEQIFRTVRTGPESVRAQQATENLVSGIAAEFGLLTGTEVGELLGSSSKESSRNLASARHRAGELLAIRRGNHLAFPTFQFTADGSPLPVIAALRSLAKHHDWSEPDLFVWLVTPSGRLDNVRPVDVMCSGASDAPDRLAQAADLEISREW